jgi:acylpyruvate hydrolase
MMAASLKLLSFSPAAGEAERLGLLHEERVLELAVLGNDTPASMLDFVQQSRAYAESLRQMIARGWPQTGWHELSTIHIAPPLRRPGKIMAIGLNYREHAAEGKREAPSEPVIFAKFPTSVIAPAEEVRIPRQSQFVDYEVELGVIIGQRGRDIAPSAALDHVAGYTILNDVTARDLQRSDKQWVRAKSFDTFCPLGPYVVPADEWEFPPQRGIRLRVNGELRQESNTREMIFDVAYLVAHLSAAFTLEPGDIIATGTPSGVGFYRDPPVALKDGDVVEAEIDGIGVLRSRIRS